MLPLDINEVRDQLSPRQYEVLLLRFGHEMSLDEVADNLGICNQRVAQHLKAIRRKFPSLPRRLTHGRRRRTSEPQAGDAAAAA